MDQSHGNHILHAVIAVGGIVQRPGLVHDAHQRALAVNVDALDVGKPVSHVGMQPERALHSGLSVHAGSDELEHGILNYIVAIGPLEGERFAVAKAVVKSPLLRCQHRRVTHLAGHRHAREADPFGHGIARGPALAPAGIGRLAVDAQAGVYPGIGYGVDDFIAPAAHHVCDHRRRGHARQHRMIDADGIEVIFDGNAALDFVGLDQRFEQVAHGQRLLPPRRAPAAQGIRGGQQPAEIVRGVAALCGGKRVIEIQPADHAAEIERRFHRIEHEGGSRHARPQRHHRAGDHRAQQLGAVGIVQCIQRARQRIGHAQARNVKHVPALQAITQHVVGNISQFAIGTGTLVGTDFSGHGARLLEREKGLSCYSRLRHPSITLPQ